MGDAKRHGIADECPSSRMRSYHLVFGMDLVNTVHAPVIRLVDRLVNAGQFTELFQVVVHLLVADDRESLVIPERDVLVFVKDGTAVLVEFNSQQVGGLDGRDFNAVILDVTATEVVDIGIAQPRETAEEEHVTHSFEISLGLRNPVIPQLVLFFPRQEDNRLFGVFQFRIIGVVDLVPVIVLIRRPPQEPFEEPQLFLDGAVAHVHLVGKEVDVVIESFLGEVPEGYVLVEIPQVVLLCRELFVCRLCPVFQPSVLFGKLIIDVPE